MFLEEARLAATLNHPNIVAVYEVGRWEGAYYLAMEYLPGDNLSVLARLAGNVREGHSGVDSFFRVAPPAPALEIGRVLKLSVVLPAEADVVALPVQSIYENDRVYQVVDDRLQALTVERVGDHSTAAGEYRVLVRGAGLHAGAKVITTQLPKAISGLRVQPVG